MARTKRVAKAGDPMEAMRLRYQRAVDAERDQRDLAIKDFEFVTVPGAQWDAHMRSLRKNRPCYEFNIARAHWRQVVNDQKKARPSIKVRAVENGDAEGAELRQGLILNIEQTSNADCAYDLAFETIVASGFGAWLIKTDYSTDDAWEQDIRVCPIDDPLNSVWLDPDNLDDPMFGFIEETMSRSAFEAKYPKAQAVSFESSRTWDDSGWFGEDQVRVVAYYRKVKHRKTIVLLSDGRSVDKEEIADALDELAQEGVTIVKERECDGHKVVMSICSGIEEIDGPYELVFHKIPIVAVYANRQKLNGRLRYCGMVRFSRDSQKLVNFNLTTAMEAVAKVPKSPYLITLKMLEGKGVLESWERAGAENPYFLPYTPDPNAPQSRPSREPPPDVPAALLQLTSSSVDMLKATDGIYDASVGARSNETSGRAIIARQQEGETATFDYQDALAVGKQRTGDLILRALPKVYDTMRTIRVLGKDGSDKQVQLYQEVRDTKTGKAVKINDLSVGKYDVTVSTGANYDTQRMEFLDVMSNMTQSNPMIAQAAPDLMVKHMDFPGAAEMEARLKLILPPPIQQAIAEGKQLPPEVIQAQQQVQAMGEQVQQQMQVMQQASAELEQEKAAVGAEKQQVESQKKLLDAEFKRMQAELKAATIEAQSMQATIGNELKAREETVAVEEERVEEETAAITAAQTMLAEVSALAIQQAEQQAQLLAQMQSIVEAVQAPKPAMQVVRDDQGRVAGIVPVEVVNGA